MIRNVVNNFGPIGSTKASLPSMVIFAFTLGFKVKVVCGCNLIVFKAGLFDGNRVS